MLISFHAHPEDPGRSGSREEAGATKADLRRYGLNPAQFFLDGFELFGLSDEFQGDVQRSGRDPAHVGCKLAHTVHKTQNALADSIVEIDGDEEAHFLAVSTQF